MKTPSHHHPTTSPTSTLAFDEQVAMEAAEIRDAQKLEDAYVMKPGYSYVQCEEEHEEGRLAMEEFSGSSVIRFILETMADEYCVAGIVASGIPEWMIQKAARTAILGLDFAILNKAESKHEPKGERSLAKTPHRSLRRVRRSNIRRRA